MPTEDLSVSFISPSRAGGQQQFGRENLCRLHSIEVLGAMGGLAGSGSSSRVTPRFGDTRSSGLPTSDGGMAKTTSDVQTAKTLLEAAWDSLDEVVNGSCDRERVSPSGYPRARHHTASHPLRPKDWARPRGPRPRRAQANPHGKPPRRGSAGWCGYVRPHAQYPISPKGI
jgi:hypothetical protein